MHRDYLFSEFPELSARYAAVTTPITSFYAIDDELLAASAFQDLAHRYGGADLRPLDPAEYGLERIGHAGFFRRGNDPMWEATIGGLTSPLGQPLLREPSGEGGELGAGEGLGLRP